MMDCRTSLHPHILILNQQEVIIVSECLIHIIIRARCSDSFWAFFPELQSAHQASSCSAETL